MTWNVTTQDECAAFFESLISRVQSLKSLGVIIILALIIIGGKLLTYTDGRFSKLPAKIVL